jgi:hypothetical protein
MSPEGISRFSKTTPVVHTIMGFEISYVLAGNGKLGGKAN